MKMMAALVGLVALGCVGVFARGEDVMKEEPALKECVLAGGCFGGGEGVLEEREGVKGAVSGFAGSGEGKAGSAEEAHGRGYAEAVRVVYDPGVIDYVALLEVFFATHDPTSLNRQGADVGVEYRSAVFWKDAAEKEAAEGMIRALEESGAYGGKRVVTTVEELKDFVEARAGHQDYVCNNRGQPYVEQVAMEKVKKVREKFKERLKAESPLKR